MSFKKEFDDSPTQTLGIIFGMVYASCYIGLLVISQITKKIYNSYNIYKMKKHEDEIKLEYPKPPQELNRFKCMNSKDLQKYIFEMKNSAKNEKLQNEVNHLYNLMVDATKKGEPFITLPKNKKPSKQAKQILRNDLGFDFEKISKGCLGKTMRIMKHGSDLMDNVRHGMESFQSPL